MKSRVYNLIILDESGSMSCVRKATIDGCNETLSSIRSAQECYGETQDHLVSIYAFNSNGSKPSRYICKNVPAASQYDITNLDYCPGGCTPLYDAIGSTLVDLKACTAETDSIANVTIITDGMENSSCHYTLAHVQRLIAQLKELGWAFNFIGANIDVQATAIQLNIDNAMAFTQSEDGMREMYEKERRARESWFREQHRLNLEDSGDNDEESIKARIMHRITAAKNYFKK